MTRSPSCAAILGVISLGAGTAEAQNRVYAAESGSSNVHIVAHVPLGWQYTTADIEIEQELARPYVYVQRDFGVMGFEVLSLKDPARARVIYSWRIPQHDLHIGRGGSDGHYFKHAGRYYYAQSFHFSANGPDGDLGIIVFDMTGLPDSSTVREVGRIRIPEAPGGVHTLSPYKHSDGRVLLFATSRGGARIYDMAKFLAKDSALGYLGMVPGLEVDGRPAGYHDYYVAYDPAARQDKFYGAGSNYYTVYNVSKPEAPTLVTSITGAAGVAMAHTIQVSPDGRYAATQTEYAPAPMRFWDLKPGLDGTVKTISRPIGAWQASWDQTSHNLEMRWPYVFIGSFEDGLQILNMMDPTNPYTVGYYNTRPGSHYSGQLLSTGLRAGDPAQTASIYERAPAHLNGVWGVDVRNADGLIVVSDYKSGFWAFKMDGFDGWNGHQWGMPNISSVQDWDNGPDGAPRPQRVSLR